MDLQCGCVWANRVTGYESRCPSQADGEDGLCDSCRRSCGEPGIVASQLRDNRVRKVI